MRNLIPVLLIGLFCSTSLFSEEIIGRFELKIIKNKKEITLNLENFFPNACQLELNSIKITRSRPRSKGSIELTYNRNLNKECRGPESSKLRSVIIKRSNQLPGIGPKKGSYDIIINGEYYKSIKFFGLVGYETNNG
jgi:hypothetical protein